MIGLGLLSRFNLVFDFHRQRLYIEPNNSFALPFDYAMTGFDMGPFSAGYSVIRRVHDLSPAAEAGLRAGDKILRVNDKPVREYDFFDLRSLFKQNGATVNLMIERDGEERNVSLVLRPVI